MTTYLVTMNENETAHANATPAETAKLLDEQSAFAKRLRASGAMLDGGRVRPSAEGKRVRRRNGKLEVTSGPFAEDGRAITGYCVVEADSVNAAVALFKEMPMLSSDAMEVRPAMKCAPLADKGGIPGKVFLISVLGNEKSEAAWTGAMDRIDNESACMADKEGFLGGVRLEAPTTGRTIKGASKAVMDGPFFESKEVIGGLCFRRFANMDEAVRWAAESPGSAHGTLELRELWRS
jgi:hypothetical protein